MIALPGRFLSSRIYEKSGKAIIATKDEECFLLRAGARNARGRRIRARAFSDIYIGEEKEREERKRREKRGDEKEGDGEKGIRAGITLGDCGIVNPCRVALVLLLFLSPLLSLFVCLFSTLFSSPPTLSVTFIAPFRSSSLPLSLVLVSLSPVLPILATA